MWVGTAPVQRGDTLVMCGKVYYLPKVILVGIKYSLGVGFWCLGDLRIVIYVEFWV